MLFALRLYCFFLAAITCMTSKSQSDIFSNRTIKSMVLIYLSLLRNRSGAIKRYYNKFPVKKKNVCDRKLKWVSNVAIERTNIHVGVLFTFLFAVGSDISILRLRAPMAAAISPFMSPLSPSSQPMMSDNISDEDRLQHRELRPLLFSNSVWVL